MSALVPGTCPCGCATINIAVDRGRSGPAVGLSNAAVHCYSRQPVEADQHRELIVFIEGGWLSGLEVVFYDGPPPAEFPDLDLMEPPYIG